MIRFPLSINNVSLISKSKKGSRKKKGKEPGNLADDTAWGYNHFAMWVTSKCEFHLMSGTRVIIRDKYFRSYYYYY